MVTIILMGSDSRVWRLRNHTRFPDHVFIGWLVMGFFSLEQFSVICSEGFSWLQDHEAVLDLSQSLCIG